MRDLVCVHRSIHIHHRRHERVRRVSRWWNSIGSEETRNHPFCEYRTTVTRGIERDTIRLSEILFRILD